MLSTSKLVRSSQLALRQSRAANGVLSIRAMETYTQRQEKKGRPVAPHVEIYDFPLVALSSITNRITGVVLSGGLTAIGAMTLVGVDAPSVVAAIGQTAVIGTVAKFGVSFSLIYHWLGGVRHLVWDRDPEMLTNEQVEKSSKIVIGIASASSAALAFL